MSSAMAKQDLAVIEKLPGNNACVDCGKPRPRWASVSYGILMCLECSGVHRSLGSHISFVRSVQMDSFPENHLEAMRHGGNQNCNDFLAKYDVVVDAPTSLASTIREKYQSPAAELYRQVLQARIAGTPEPTELPERKEGETEEQQQPMRKMQGFGSSPHPSELEDSNNKKKKKAFLVGASSAAMAIGAVAIGLASRKR